MISEEGDSLLRFLNNISYQLACLLNADGWPPNSSKETRTISPSAAATRQNSNSVRAQPTAAKQTKGSTKQLVGRLNRLRPSKASKRKRQKRLIAEEEKTANLAASIVCGEQHEQTDHEIQTKQSSLSIDIEQSQAPPPPETLDGHLTLSIGDEIPLGEHCASISPSATHLSPLEPSIVTHFGPALHAQANFYVHQRQGHPMDTYQSLHDEFQTPTGHETTIPIDAISSPNPLHHRQQPMSNQVGAVDTRQQQQIDHQQHPRAAHLVDHQNRNPQAISSNNLTECYTSAHLSHNHHQSEHHLLLHGNHSHQHHNQEHHNNHHLNHNQQPIQHPPQLNYHQLDHQWLGPAQVTDHSNAGATLQFGAIESAVAADSPTIDHAVRLASPAHHQAIDHVQHYVPLYHHSCYANHPNGQIDSFHQNHLADDDYHARDPLALTSPRQADPGSLPENRQQSNLVEHQRANHSRMTSSLNEEHNSHSDDRNSNNTNSHNNLASYEQSHHHQNQNRHHQLHLEHAQHHHHSIHLQPSESQQLHIYHDSPQNLHLLNHPNGQSHHMMTLMNGIEPSAVILQDINLASANWSSPEDLYSI